MFEEIINHNARLEHMTLADVNKMTDSEKIVFKKISLELVAPMARQTGLYRIQKRIEDNLLRLFYENTFEYLTKRMESLKQNKRFYMQNIENNISEKLKKNGITNPHVEGRLKHIYSVHRKMEDQKLPFEEIFDIIAFRVKVNTEKEVYDVLRLIQEIWPLVPGKLKDYIKNPKENGYQSLHITVTGPEGRNVEIQIRTHEMHEIAENGTANHARVYKPKFVDSNKIEDIFNLLSKESPEFQEDFQNWKEVHRVFNDPSNKDINFLDYLNRIALQSRKDLSEVQLVVFFAINVNISRAMESRYTADSAFIPFFHSNNTLDFTKRYFEILNNNPSLFFGEMPVFFSQIFKRDEKN